MTESTAIEKRTPAQELVAQIRSPQFLEQVRYALPTDVNPERFVRVAVTAILETPSLVDSDKDALFQGLLKCAQDGLLPDGREAALVIFGKKATYLPMMGGFRKIAAEHGWSIDTQVVYELDDFHYELGLNPTLTHKPPALDQPHGLPIGAYAVGTHEDGRKQVEVFTREQIEKVQAVSRTKDKGPWVEWTDRMWEKTAGRRLFAKLPLGGSERASRVLEAADEGYELDRIDRATASLPLPKEEDGAGIPPSAPDAPVAVGEPSSSDSGEQDAFPIPETARK